MLLCVATLEGAIAPGPVVAAAAQWQATGSMCLFRLEHSATLLSTGHVLVTGGFMEGNLSCDPNETFPAELYDPATGTWSVTGAPHLFRAQHQAVLLPSGQVLVAGGLDTDGEQPTASAELYDPGTGLWTSLKPMSTARVGFTATLLRDGRVLVAGGAAGQNAMFASELYDPATGRWVLTGALETARAFHTATLLPNGQVLVAGGTQDGSQTAELYDPFTGGWTFTTGSMVAYRLQHTATLLPSGLVLAAGGANFNLTPNAATTAELYDPATGQWTATGALNVARSRHTATLLPSGTLLVTGGCTAGDLNCNLGVVGSAELYDQASWALTAALPQTLYDHTATLLPSGQVLVAGGGSNSGGLPSNAAELYDPGDGQWTRTASLGAPRPGHGAALLPNGQVLVTGGCTGAPPCRVLDRTELYDPLAEAWADTGALRAGRTDHTLTLLPSGRVLAAGGMGAGGDPLASAELYDPGSARWSATGVMSTGRTAHTATLLGDGRVLAVGGEAGGPLASAELYDPARGRWIVTGFLHTARGGHTATLLPSGQVLVTGGSARAADVTGSAELYDPVTGRFTDTGPLATPRAGHTATLLPSGRVLVAGGHDETGIPLAGAEVYDPAAGRFTSTGALATARTGHTAVPLRTGRVLVGGGCAGTPCQGLESTELYDPAVGSWTTGGILNEGRTGHTATLLLSGGVLVAGGDDGGFQALGSAEVWDAGVGFLDAWRPVVTLVTPVSVGAAVGVAGNLFQGISEASGGGTTQQSPTNYPIVQLSRQEGGQTLLLPVDPLAGWSDNSFTSLPLANFPGGPAALTVITNGIPSLAQPVMVDAGQIGCPGRGGCGPRAGLRFGRVELSPSRVPLGGAVEVSTTLRTGAQAVPDVVVRFYDSDPGRGGQVFHAERVSALPPHAAHALDAHFSPTRCGTGRVFVLAGEGSPLEVEARSGPLRVDCGTR